MIRLRPDSLYPAWALLLLSVLLVPFVLPLLATAEGVDLGQVSVEHTDVGNDLVKYTWSATVENRGGEDVTVTVALVLVDAEGHVIGSSVSGPHGVPAGGSTAIFQSEPISKLVWDQVASHAVEIR